MPHFRSLCLAPMLFTLSICKRWYEKYSLSSPCPLLLNILFNPDIPDRLSYNCMLPWTHAGVFQLCHLVLLLTHTLLSFAGLQSRYQVPNPPRRDNTHWLLQPTYMQLLCPPQSVLYYVNSSQNTKPSLNGQQRQGVDRAALCEETVSLLSSGV